MGKVSRKIQVTSTNNGKDVTKTFNYANTESTNEELATFANNLYGLTDNTIKTVMKVDRENISDATEEVTGVTFNLNLDLFAQNPDFINQGLSEFVGGYSGLNPISTWVNSSTLDGDNINFKFNYTYTKSGSERVASDTVTVSSSQSVFAVTVNSNTVTYNLGQWINFDSDSLIADLNQKLTDTTVAYSNGTLTFTDNSALNIKPNGDLFISKWLQNYIGSTYSSSTLPNGISISQSMGVYTVEVNLTDTGITTLGDTVTNPSPSYTILNGEYSADVQAKIDSVNSTVMPKFNQILGGDSSVTVDNIDSSTISTLAYYGSRTKIGDTSTWIVYPVQFTSGSGEVKFGAGDFGISTENWSNYSWAFIVKFTDSATCYSNLTPQSSTNIMNRLIVDNVGNSTALIYLVPKTV